MENLLSKRAEICKNEEDFLFKYLHLCNSNLYDEKDNPMGYVNFGTAVNNLCRDIVHPRITSNDIWSCDTSLLQYRESHGILRIREVFAKVMTELLECHEPVSANDLIFFTGITGCIDALAHCLADPGEVFLVPTPFYGRIITFLRQRALVDVWPIPVITEDDSEEYPVLTVDKIVTAYENAIAAHRVVRGVFLVNPNNPLGDICSSEILLDIMLFCKANDLHFIIDEIYALSTFSKTEKFYSILKFSSIPDPERTHVLYGLSKDFGMAGVRVGLIHTKSEPLKKCLRQLSCFHTIPFPLMEIAARYLEDLEWCKNYLNIYQQRVTEKFDYCVNFLKRIGLEVRDSPAILFLWVDFRHLCGGSFDQEIDFFNYLIEKAHLFIAPGKEFLCAQPGWFRIVFAGNPDHLDEGLSRLERAVKAYKPRLNT